MACNCKCHRQSQEGGVYTYQCDCDCATSDSGSVASESESLAGQGELANWLHHAQGDGTSGLEVKIGELARKVEDDSTNYLRQQLNPEAATAAGLEVDSAEFERENPGAREALDKFLGSEIGRAARMQFPLHMARRGGPDLKQTGGEGLDYYRLYKKYKRKYKQLG